MFSVFKDATKNLWRRTPDDNAGSHESGMRVVVHAPEGLLPVSNTFDLQEPIRRVILGGNFLTSGGFNSLRIK